MFADASHSIAFPAADRLRLFAWRLLRRFERPASARLPAELRRLPDHLLRDIGIDPRDVSPESAHPLTTPDILHSPAAMAAFLATTVR